MQKQLQTPKSITVKPTQKRVYLTRHAQAEHKYVLVLELWDYASKQFASIVSPAIGTVRSPYLSRVDRRTTNQSHIR